MRNPKPVFILASDASDWTLSAASCNEGNLVLVGKDKIGHRVEKYFVKAHRDSDSLRQIILEDDRDCNSDRPDLVLHFPNITAESLGTLIKMMREHDYTPQPKERLPTDLLAICEMWDMEHLARIIIHKIVPVVCPHDLLETFCWTSHFNMPQDAEKLLTSGAEAHHADALEDLDNDDGCLGVLLPLEPLPSRWLIETARRIRPEWVWRLCTAERLVDLDSRREVRWDRAEA